MSVVAKIHGVHAAERPLVTDWTVTTIYTYDYANRLIGLNAGGATTTYGYDAFGSRVFQIGTSSTTTYPFKYYSVARTTIGSANWATTTDYIFNGDTLLSTIDQQFKNGVATGSAQTRYVHPDHLGSIRTLPLWIHL
jgi:YD repeat-containing protein